jgi:adenylosuccinate synthase
MPALVIVGAQWGDEGKGKITDFLAASADAVVRYQGGGNAGHTLVVGDEEYKLHLVPSGVLRPGKECILGNGMVVDLEALAAELEHLAHRRVEGFRLLVSASAHIILPYHKAIDAREESRKGSERIGTTGQGIGPAYHDKVNRIGIRVGDCARPHVFAHKFEVNRRYKESVIGRDAIDWDALRDRQIELFEGLRAYVGDASARINALLDEGKRVLFEGAQGTFLDLDHGTYPFVTSSTPTAGGACVGSGVGPSRIDEVIGVSKAYTTRVGAGPFPTELTGEEGELLVQRGREFGTTTGRKRRCGWLDLVALRRAAQVNGLRGLAISKLDVLDGFDRIRLCTGYRIGGDVHRDFPDDPWMLEDVEPVYEDLPGWQDSTSNIERWDDLPREAQIYVRRIEEQSGASVQLISVGADRGRTIVRQDPWECCRRAESQGLRPTTKAP